MTLREALEIVATEASYTLESLGANAVFDPDMKRYLDDLEIAVRLTDGFIATL